MSFRITGLPAENFDHLFAMSYDELAAQGAVRRKADGPAPCRVSLTDAAPGDEVILVNYEHHAVDSPYRMRFAIFVRKGEETYDKIDEVPQQLRTRTLAARAFDADGMMVSYIQSNYAGFGSGVVVPGTGISLQNRGLGFTLEPGHPNQVAPRKRPFQTIIPGFVTRNGAPA